jgi:hyperosmotically inducible protein
VLFLRLDFSSASQLNRSIVFPFAVHSAWRKRYVMVSLRLQWKVLAYICLMSAFLGCATTQNQKVEQQLDDQTITAKVQTALSNDPSLKKFTIEVKTYHGEVVLKGKVDSLEDVYRAAEIVNPVEGVKSVFNDLDVK